MDENQVFLPWVGLVTVVPDPKAEGHFLFLDLDGWHDCARSEDEIIRKIRFTDAS